MALISDITRVLDFLLDDSKLPHLRASLRKFQRITSLKVDLPLAELEVAHEDMEAFMNVCLHELSSQKDSQELVGELSQRLSKHNTRIQELVRGTELAEEVSQRVIVGLMAQQPLEVDFFPGILEGLVGRLGLAPPGMANPPTSIREGVMQHWVAALREVVKRTEGVDQDPGLTATDVMP